MDLKRTYKTMSLAMFIVYVITAIIVGTPLMILLTIGMPAFGLSTLLGYLLIKSRLNRS